MRDRPDETPGSTVVDAETSGTSRSAAPGRSRENASPANASRIVVDRTENVATVTLRWPESRNALSTEILEELASALRDLEESGARCVTIAGSSKVFASGADLRSIASAQPLELYFAERGRYWKTLREIRIPLIAAVSGYCLGGGFELALLCDVIIAGDGAMFGFPETGLGIIPGGGGTQILPRLLGKAKAMDVILAGRLLTAAECGAAGVISRVVADDRVVAECRDVASKIASRAPIAQRLAKEAVQNANDTSLKAGLEMERHMFAMALASADAEEGIKAFLEKRDPVWRNR